MSKKIIVLVGPTASGKSSLAVSLAKKFVGEVISADSRQVYRSMDLGSGKVPRDKRHPLSNSIELLSGYFHKGIRHHMLDVASSKRVFTADDYKRLARKTIADIWKRGKIPILCGGTGFYIDSAIYGAEFPKVPPSPSLRKKMDKKTTEALFEELIRLDKERASSIDSKNRHRVMRALEIVHALGKVPKVKSDPLNADILFLGIQKDSLELKKLIELRLKKRMRQGMLKEIQKLYKSGVSWTKLESFGLEYKWGALFLQKKISKKEMEEGILKDSAQYAKRQMTWFKRNKETHWVKSERESLPLIRDFLEDFDTARH